MVKLLEALAARSLVDGAVKCTGLVALIVGAHFAVDYLLDGRLSMPPGELILTTTLVGAPVLALLMAAVAHFSRLEQALAVTASTDMLTGLPNRRAFFAAAGEMLEAGQEGLVLLVDVDHFKAINDTHGHAAGDICLRAIADHLRMITRKGDVVARIGGEEFAVFMPNSPASAVPAIEQRLCERLSVRISQDAEALLMTVSAGATTVQSGDAIERLLTQADNALYRAKAAGRACLVVHRQHDTVTPFQKRA
ncbi:GGDEF domain-containing protein [Aestuariibius sp. 2305UL40-4]|uniref:GGDEF domain-containing protein n=1 Tax=Aestuariibius violaceus TaxID=3234132 RepID=UPI00345E3D33